MNIEQGILSGIMADSALLEEISFLQPEDFFDPLHVIMFRKLLELKVADEVTLSRAIPEQTEYILNIAKGYVNSSSVSYYARQLKEASTRDKAIKSLQKGEDILEVANILLSADIHDSQPTSRAGEALGEVTASLETERPLGIFTGIRSLDRKLGSIREHNFIVIAARPSMGKTALALSMMYSMAKNDIPVMIFSLEMSKTELVERLICFEYNACLQDLTLRLSFAEQYPKACKGAAIVSSLPIFINDKGALSVEELCSIAKKETAKHGIKAIFIDYLQLMKSRKRTNTVNEEVGHISRTLKGLAKTLNVPVITLSQLNRKCEERTNKRPMLADIRDSGSVEQDADKVLFIYRDEVYNRGSDKDAEIIIAKNRQGDTGYMELTFLKDSMRFIDTGGYYE